MELSDDQKLASDNTDEEGEDEDLEVEELGQVDVVVASKDEVPNRPTGVMNGPHNGHDEHIER